MRVEPSGARSDANSVGCRSELDATNVSIGAVVAYLSGDHRAEALHESAHCHFIGLGGSRPRSGELRGGTVRATSTESGARPADASWAVKSILCRRATSCRVRGPNTVRGDTGSPATNTDEAAAFLIKFF